MILRRATSLLIGLTLANLALWGLAISFFDSQAVLIGTGALAFGLGLRHAIDPDHLAAIDNATRKLTGEGKMPLAVGFFFALGHSAFVLLIVILLALTALKLGDARMALWQHYGDVFASLFSALFLFLIGFTNLKSLIAARHGVHYHQTMRPMGRMWTRYISPLFGSISQSRHMLPVGFLFALSFDTATEVSLFGLTAAQGLGSSLTFVQALIFPLLFAAGMIFIDTLNGLMMFSAYRWASFDARRKYRYNIIITGFSVFVAFAIGTLQLLDLAASHIDGASGIENLVTPLGDHATMLGLAMIAIFFTIWIGAMAMTRFIECSQAARQEG